MIPLLRTPVRRTLALGCVLALVPLTAAVAGELPDRATPPAATAPQARGMAPAVPRLSTQVVMTGLDIPWDIAVLPNQSWLVSERDRLDVTLRLPNGSSRVVVSHPSDLFARGETGMMSVLADPDIGANNRFYTCTGVTVDDAPQIRVFAWRLNDTRTQAHRVKALVTGIDTAGRHGGCRLRLDPAGALYVGTGDAAIGTSPQDLTSLNGKILRLDRFTGEPWPTNPWVNSPNLNRRYIYNYGHRNVQGLAWRPGDQMWTVEHGTDRDDEVNRAIPGGNYGWNPVPGYNEAVPMTDFSLPGKQIGARWTSGYPTIATSGAVWVRGSEWGPLEGSLAVCTLVGARLLFMKFGADNELIWVRTPPAMDQTYGRLRSVVQAGDGTLLVTTSNGSGADVIVKVSPS